MRFVSERLNNQHELDRFDSGSLVLDGWLRRDARYADANNTGRTFVWHGGEGSVQAYFTLAAHQVRREDLPVRVGRGSPDAIPAVLLARLALGRALQGQGLGGELLLDALTRAVAAGEIVAARVVVVDAVDEAAAAFYQRYHFRPVPDNSHRLVQKMSTIAKGLEVHNT